MTMRTMLVGVGFVLSLHAAPRAGQPEAAPVVSESPDGTIQVWVTAERPARPAAPARLSSAMTTAAVSTSDTFERFVRYPAEEQTFLDMDATTPRAFYRDLFAGGRTLHAGGTDGDLLTTQVTAPDGAAISFVGLRFDGARACWVLTSAPADCIGQPGAVNVRVWWVFNAQCRVTGDWRMEFRRNATNFSTGTFHLTPSINPDKVAFITAPAYNQGAYSTVQYGNICRDPEDGRHKTCSLITTPNPPTVPISVLGCLLTGYASALTYHGLPTLPTQLNDYLRDHDGYGDGGGIDPAKVERYAEARGLLMTFHRRNASAESGALLNGTARDAVCRSGPTPLFVKHHTVNNPTGLGRQHFATAWGRPEGQETYLLKDPNGGRSNRLDSTEIPRDYGNVHYGTRELRKEPVTYSFPGGLTIILGSPAELLLTDPAGRRTGLDPATSASFEEIPGSYYGEENYDPPDVDEKGVESKMLGVSPLADGNYTLKVAGTGSGKYSLNFRYTGVAPEGDANADVRDVPIAAGTVHTYRFTAPFATGVPIPLAGSFDGGGQRPRDVNKFLTYATVSRSQTTVPAGTTTYPLLVAYAPAIIPSSFSVILNGAIITADFSPRPGGFELVSIPLVRGRNTLTLTIDGQLPDRIAADTDRLVFIVP